MAKSASSLFSADLFFNDVLEDSVFQAQISVHLLQALNLFFKLIQSLDIRGFHSGII
jgi:hypothetical protein